MSIRQENIKVSLCKQKKAHLKRSSYWIWHLLWNIERNIDSRYTRLIYFSVLKLTLVYYFKGGKKTSLNTLSLWRGCSARLRNRELALLHTFPRGSLSSKLMARRPSRFRLHSGGFFRAFSSTSWSPDCRHCTSQTATEIRGGGKSGSGCLHGEIRGKRDEWKRKRDEVIMTGRERQASEFHLNCDQITSWLPNQVEDKAAK